MRLSHQLVESLFFQFADFEAFMSAVQPQVNDHELSQISRLAELNLPPVSSPEVLAALVGVNPGLVWSLLNRHERYYRTFVLESGSKKRTIHAPRIALKIIQKWLSFHLSRRVQLPSHVFGFIPGKSHLLAAKQHMGAEWAYSVDIADFFSSTPYEMVFDAYVSLGYASYPAEVLTRISCFGNALAQGAPTSPTLSNVCFREKDAALVEIAESLGCRVTRYADDIVFSGVGAMPDSLALVVSNLFETGPWRLAPQKEFIQPLKGRIKIHGVLIKPNEIRLTKGYRNKIRAYSHVLATRGRGARDYRKLVGHVQYAEYVSRQTGSPSGVAANAADWKDQQSERNPEIASKASIAAEAEIPPKTSGPNPLELLRRWFRGPE